MHYLDQHVEEMDVVRKKGYYTVQDGYVVADAPFYPSGYPPSATDDPAFPARRLELEAERYPPRRRPRTPSFSKEFPRGELEGVGRRGAAEQL